MKITAPTTTIIGETGTFQISDVDFKTAQDIVVNLSKKNVRFVLRKIDLVSNGVDTVSDGASVQVSEITEDTFTAATLSTALTGENNDLVFTAKAAGVGGNDISVEYVNPATPSEAIAVSVADKAISVSLATSAGTAQVETATCAGTVTTAGDASVTVTSALLDAPVVVSVAVAEGDGANDIADAIRTALAADTSIAEKFDVSGATDKVILTVKAAFVSANDATLNIAIADDTSVGVTTAASSANTAAGVAPAITSTAAQVKAAIEAKTEANALVSVANKAGNSGAGVVTALSEASLSGGLNWTVLNAIVDSTDLADTDSEGLVQTLTLDSDRTVIEGGNAFLFQITNGSTATADEKDVLVEYAAM